MGRRQRPVRTNPDEQTKHDKKRILIGKNSRNGAGRVQLQWWLAQGLPYSYIEQLIEERNWLVPTRQQMTNFASTNADAIADKRKQLEGAMVTEGLANKDARLREEMALYEAIKGKLFEERDQFGRPIYRTGDAIDLLELIAKETGAFGGGVPSDHSKLQVLIQNIHQGTTTNAAIEVGAKGRLLSPAELPANGIEGAASPHEHVAPLPAGRRGGQRKVLHNGEGVGAAHSPETGGEAE